MTSVTEIDAGDGVSFTQTSVIPLTTFFTPNDDCTADAAYKSTYWEGNQWAYQLDSGISTSTCYPSSYSDYQYKSGLWYSPGVCPYSYQWVATSVQRPTSGPATTLAICCPPHIYTAPNVGWSCYEVLTTSVDGGLSFSNPGTTTQPATTAFANPISVAWQESDLSLFTPASAPILALRSAGLTLTSNSTTATATTSSSSIMSTTSSTHVASSHSSGLSTSAAAGIGVGVAVVCIAIIGGLLYFLRHHKLAWRDRSFQQPPPQEASYSPTAQDIKAGLANNSLPHEIDGNPRGELDGGWRPTEASDRSIYELSSSAKKRDIDRSY